MTRRRTELVLWVLVIALAMLAGMRGRRAAIALSSPGSTGPGWETLPSPSPLTAPGSDALVSAGDTLVRRDPFRLERKPSAVAYAPGIEGAPPAPPRPPRPQLAVSGLVGGPPWEALLEGVPGRQGSVLVRRGDTLGGLRIRSITKNAVRITGMDTTWTLTVRGTWQ